MRKSNKKSMAVLEMLAYVILIILGFILLLYLYSNLDLTKDAQKKVCAQSVIFRATSSALSVGAGQNFIPIKCTTDKICITSGLIGGKCKEFEDEKIKYTKVKVSSERQVEQVIANNLIDCWTMMGEGKVSLFHQFFAQNYGVGGVYPTCVICSRIAFDTESLSKSKINLSKVDVRNFMNNYKIPEKDITYANYLSGGVGWTMEGKLPEQGSLTDTQKDEEAKKAFEELKSVTDQGLKEKISGLVKIDSSKSLPSASDISIKEYSEEASPSQELSIVFTQISAPHYHSVFFKTLGTSSVLLGGAAQYLPKGSFVRSIQMISPTGVDYGTYKVWTPFAKFAKILGITAIIAAVAQATNVFHNQYVAAGYCGDIEISGEERDGCSVVRTVNYNEEEIVKYCSVIESIP